MRVLHCLCVFLALHVPAVPCPCLYSFVGNLSSWYQTVQSANRRSIRRPESLRFWQVLQMIIRMYLNPSNVWICHETLKKFEMRWFRQWLSVGFSLLTLRDFSAKYLVRGERNVAYICSRYYRAPELVFGATDYSASIGKRIPEPWPTHVNFVMTISKNIFYVISSLKDSWNLNRPVV